MPSESQRSPRKSKGQRQRNAGKKQSQSNKQQQQQQQQQQSPNKKQVDSHIVANKTKCLNQLDQKSDKDHIKVTASSCNVPSVSNQPDETVTTEANDRLRDTDGNTAAIISQQITGRSPTKLDPLSEALSTIDLMLKNPGLPATQLSAEITVSVPTNIRHNEPNDELGNESKILEQCEARENLRGPSQANSVKHVSSHATSSSYHKALRLDKRVISKIEVDDEYLEEVDIADDVVKNLACDPEETSSYSRDADLQAQVDLGKVNLGYKTDEANSSSSSSSSSSVSTSSSSAQAAKKAQCDRVNFSPEYYSPPRQSVDQYCSLKISTESSPGRKSIDEDVNHSSSSSSFTRHRKDCVRDIIGESPPKASHSVAISDCFVPRTTLNSNSNWECYQRRLSMPCTTSYAEFAPYHHHHHHPDRCLSCQALSFVKSSSSSPSHHCDCCHNHNDALASRILTQSVQCHDLQGHCETTRCTPHLVQDRHPPIISQPCTMRCDEPALWTVCHKLHPAATSVSSNKCTVACTPNCCCSSHWRRSTDYASAHKLLKVLLRKHQ